MPGAADRVDLSPDRTVYTFHLRDDGRWSDGSLVTTDDFVFAWTRMLQEPGDYTYLLYYIQGAEEYQKAFADYSDRAHGGLRRLGRRRSGEARRKPPARAAGAGHPAACDPARHHRAWDDKRTLRVSLKHPVAYFPDVCAFPPMFPLNEKSMDKLLDDDAGSTFRRTGPAELRPQVHAPAAT